MRPPGIDGDKLRALREARGLTQRELGDLVGSDAQTVRAWEKGRFSPQRLKQKAIAEALKVAPEAFLEDVPDVGAALLLLESWRYDGEGEEPGASEVPALPGQDAGVEPGVRLLLADAALCATWAITTDEATYLRELRPIQGRRIATAEQAVRLLLVARSLPTVGAGDEDDSGATQ